MATIISNMANVTSDVLAALDAAKSQADTKKDSALAQIEVLTQAAIGIASDLNGLATTIDGGKRKSFDFRYFSPGSADEENFASEFPNPDDLDTLPGFVAEDDFSFSDSSYSAQIQSETDAVLEAMLGGGAVVGSSVRDAIYAKVTSKLSAVNSERSWAAANLGLTYGWQLPSAVTTALGAEATEQLARDTIRLAAEKVIFSALEVRDDTWALMPQANQFERIWMDDHNKELDRKARAAAEKVKQSLKINEQILRHNDQEIRAWALRWQTLLQIWDSEQARFRANLSYRDAEIREKEIEASMQDVNVSHAIAEVELENNTIVQAKELSHKILDVHYGLATMISSLAQALLAASDVKLGSDASFSYTLNEEYT